MRWLFQKRNENYKFKSEILYNTTSRRKCCSLFAYGWRKGGKYRPWWLALVTPSVASDANAHSPGYNGWSSYCAYLPFFLCLSLFCFANAFFFHIIFSLTSAVRYSKIAALYTAAVAPTRPWLVVLFFKCLWILPTGNWKRNQTYDVWYRWKKKERKKVREKEEIITSKSNSAFVAR